MIPYEKKNLRGIIREINGEEYFIISANIWQIRKMRTVKETYKANSIILTEDKFKYRILNSAISVKVPFLIIQFKYKLSLEVNFYGGKTIYVNITDCENLQIIIQNHSRVEAVYSQIESSQAINQADKEQILIILGRIKKGRDITKRDIRILYEKLKEWRPYVNSALNIITTMEVIMPLKDWFKKIEEMNS